MPASKATPQPEPALSAPLRAIAANPRVTIRRAGEPLRDGKCVVYWMQRAERGIDNPALDVAIALGNELGIPVIAFFSAISNFPHANLRHYRFLNQGLVDVEADLAERNVSFIVRRPPDNKLEKLLAELGAAIVVGDENPMREPERWRAVLAHRLQIPFWTVDADVIVPSNSYTKHFFAVHHFRPKLYADMARFMENMGEAAPRAEHDWRRPRDFESFNVRDDVTAGWRNFDRSVPPCEEWTGGTHAALKLLRDFVKHKLADYDTVRNHPEKDGTSRISPALHFGHIGPLTVIRAIEESVARGESTKEARDAYYSEVLAWRELSINFVKYVPNYDSIDCAPEWAQKTLKAHSRDKRDPLYTPEQMERGDSYDEMWNAAQQQMVRHGWMHNYLRMYWAKKILEWSATPAQAWETCVYLNDKYFLDGRDPNGYAGIAWALGGVHDRPWFERPIFGTIRYMSGASTGKKFNSKRYIQNVRKGARSGIDLHSWLRCAMDQNPVPLPVEVYLHCADYEPDAEYVDGQIEERYLGEYDHTTWQYAIQKWFDQHAHEWEIKARVEYRVQVSATRYRVPDVVVFDRSRKVEQILTHPPIAVFEVLSPEDRMTRMLVKLADYEAMGIPVIRVIEPETQLAYSYAAGLLTPLDPDLRERVGGEMVIDWPAIRELLLD